MSVAGSRSAGAGRPALGVCYYPEHWDPGMWESDAAHMRKLGLEWVRIGEFAWSRIEPAPGDLRLDWLAEAIATLKKAGLKVVLGTPTACPPRWMIRQVPDLYMVDCEGRTRGFGSRRHYTHASAGYRAQCERIATVLAQRFGKEVDGWQIDNEYGCHDTALSYGPADTAAFREWARARYRTPEQLNEAWGNIFWSMDYGSFDELEPPILTPAEPNPAHALAWRRCASDQIIAFNRVQTEAIRAHSDAPITHNFMGSEYDYDHYAMASDIDFACWDSYPLGHLQRNADATELERAQYVRQGDPDYQSFHHDLYRAVGKGRLWIMEQQPGPVNWAAHNPVPLPGAVRLWTWAAFAHGAEVVSYFRWRQCPFAQEQMHSGLLLPDGSEGPACEEVKRVAAELARAGDWGTGKAAEAAIVFDFDSHGYWSVQPQGEDFDYGQIVFALYRALRSLGIEVDFVPPDGTGLSGRKLVLVPAVAHVGDALAAGLRKCGAQVLAGPRTGSKTKEFAIPSALPPGVLAESCGVRITAVESLPETVAEPLDGGGSLVRWAEHAQSLPECETVLGTKAGRLALTRKGKFWYLAGWPDRAAAKRICSMLAKAAGMETKSLPDGIRMKRMGEAPIYLNYGSESASIGSSGGSKSVELEPCGVCLPASA